MNVLSSCSFACTAALIYKKAKNLKGAVPGLALGVVVMCCVMLLWNYLITPLYMKIDRSQVASLLLPAILPFNLLKGCLNAAITFLIYKPIVSALRKTNLIVSSQDNSMRKRPTGAIIVSVVILVTCILSILAFKGII
jgi:riboflavin transporter FmnP